MKQYLDLLRHVRDRGIFKADRTGTGTTSVFGHQMRFDLQDGFPLVTTKKLHLKSIVHELIWFLSGQTSIEYLKQNGVSIWDEWADENGELGPVYGHQWRSWPTVEVLEPTGPGFNDNMVHHGATIVQKSIDQITDLIHQLKTNPDSRRLIVSAWNVADIPKMKLPPCHALFQFYTRELTAEERHSYWLGMIDDSVKQGEGWERLNAYWVNYQEALTNGIDAEGHMDSLHGDLDTYDVPKRALDCQLYQRSH